MLEDAGREATFVKPASVLLELYLVFWQDALYGVRLSCACLPLGKDGAILTLDRVLTYFLAKSFEYLLIIDIFVKNHILAKSTNVIFNIFNCNWILIYIHTFVLNFIFI